MARSRGPTSPGSGAGGTELKIVTVLGARPQFIKASTVSRAISAHNRHGGVPLIEEVIIHTGQHFDRNMSRIFFEQLEIPRPDHQLEIGGLSHGAMTGRMIEQIEGVLKGESPDWVLVYGDTNSTLAGALAAAKLHLPIAHVEAGLRSQNMDMPEELNRVLTDRISTLLLCPTEQSVRNLEKEGYPFNLRAGKKQKIIRVGDVMFDAARHVSDISRKALSLSDWKLQARRFAVCTLHREENLDDPKRLSEIMKALARIAENMTVVLPLHPRTRNRLTELGLLPETTLRCIDPLGYLEMQVILQNAAVALTDSGGLQKEAFFHQVPCITLRNETEWVETVSSGMNELAGADFKRIMAAFDKLTRSGSSPEVASYYGAGDASQRIVKILLDVEGKAFEHGT